MAIFLLIYSSLLLSLSSSPASAFTLYHPPPIRYGRTTQDASYYKNNNINKRTRLLSSSNQKDSETISDSFTLKRIQTSSSNLLIPDKQVEDPTPFSSTAPAAAQTNTINTRLMAEIEAASRAEGGPKTKLASQMNQLFQYSPSKTAEERQRALDDARDLNGIDPVSTLVGGVVACVLAYGIWTATQYLAMIFLSHPVSLDAPYMFARLASVFRNLVMGILSLASGFFFVTGVGIFLLGVRVTQGVASGELDPTRKVVQEEVVLPNVWDLMMGKKPGRRG